MAIARPAFDFYSVRRAELFDADVLHGLNTYRNWGPFTAPIQKIEMTENPEEDEPLNNTSVKSLFNPVYAVGYDQFIQMRQNSPIIDSPNTRREMRYGKDCSIKALVEASQKNMLGRAVYSYADFMYCKHLGKVPNNYLITLRRFPFPAADHINYINPYEDIEKGENGHMQHNPDSGRLVTWLGVSGNDMSKILSWNVKMPWREMKGKEEQGGGGDDNNGPLGTFLNATTNTKYRQQMVQGYSGNSTFNYMSKMKSTGWAMGMLGKVGDTSAPYTGAGSFTDQNKIYGPLNVINRTHIRDIGLEFNHDIELVFDYELRSYDGINPRMAFLDLLGNILAVTYDNGAFWGGCYRGSGASQSNIFANLPIYKLNGTESFSDVVGAFVESGQQVMKGLGGGTGNVIQDIKNIAQTLAKGVFSALLGASLNALGRPQKHGVNSLLSPAPVGFWHLTVGNPWHPIMTIGNLIMEDAKIEQYGPLGLDDFPTGLKVTVKLKHGKDRDSTQIEHMFMQGEDRFYTPVDTEVLEMYNASDKVAMVKRLEYQQAKQEALNRMAYFNIDDEVEKEMYLDEHPELSQKASDDAIKIMQYMKSKPVLDENLDISSWETEYNEEDYIKNETDHALETNKALVERHFYQWFGTNDETVITNIAREAAYGSKQSGKDKTGKHK